jgi:hypothetical protein
MTPKTINTLILILFIAILSVGSGLLGWWLGSPR